MIKYSSLWLSVTPLCHSVKQKILYRETKNIIQRNKKYYTEKQKYYTEIHREPQRYTEIEP